MIALIEASFMLAVITARFFPDRTNAQLLDSDSANRILFTEIGERCETWDKKIGNCTQLPNCPELFYQIKFTSRLNLHPDSVKLLRRYQCGFDRADPLICCPELKQPEETTPDAPPPDLTDRYLTTQMDLTQHPNFKLLPNNCGNSDRQKIFGGSITGLFDYPWMALLSYRRFSDDSVFFECGGTIINNRYILTAAHCLNNLRDKYLDTVRLGEHDTITNPDCEGPANFKTCGPDYEDFGVEKFIIHPFYNRSTRHHDIGLIRLNRTIKFDINKDPICLPLTENLINQDLAGAAMTIAGWGLTENGTQLSTVLLQAEVPVVNNEQCGTVYRALTRPRSIVGNQICAGGKGGVDSCHGDSGGPLMGIGQLWNMPRYVEYGIISFGHKNCGTLGIPAVHTRISNYMVWLLDQLEP